MKRTITSGDIEAICLTTSLFEEATLSIKVAGEWIELIKQIGGRVACISQIDRVDMQRCYSEQSKSEDIDVEF